MGVAIFIDEAEQVTSDRSSMKDYHNVKVEAKRRVKKLVPQRVQMIPQFQLVVHWKYRNFCKDPNTSKLFYMDFLACVGLGATAACLPW